MTRVGHGKRDGHRSRGLLMSAKTSSRTLTHTKHTAGSICKLACVCHFVVQVWYSIKTNSQEVLRDGCHKRFQELYTSKNTHSQYTHMIEFSLTVENSETSIFPAAKNVSVTSSRRPLLCTKGPDKS